MIEVLIGTVVAILTTLIIFPSRAGPAFAAHIRRTFAPLFSVLHQTLAAALGQPLDEAAMRTAATRIRAAFATGDSLARETQMEAAGYLAEHSDPDAVLRTLRRLWHTEIMLWRSVAQPLPVMAVAALRPDIERLSAALDAVCARLMQPGVSYVAPDLSAVEAALDAIEREVEDMRARGALRELSMDDVIRLMAFDFALGQLRHNMRDLAERSQELASFAGATSPLLQRVRAVLGRS